MTEVLDFQSLSRIASNAGLILSARQSRPAEPAWWWIVANLARRHA